MTRVHIMWERKPSQPVAENLRGVIADCLRLLNRRDSEVHLLLTGDDRIRQLNLRFRDCDEPTDVLSFPDGDILPSGRTLLGEVAISVDAVRRQAAAGGHSEVRELFELALHGVLHLLGYDHERDQGEMNTLELRLREEILC